jgi:hypothetical protein
MANSTVKRFLSVPTDVDDEMMYLAESAGQKVEDVYVLSAKLLIKLPIAVLQKEMPEFYQQLNFQTKPASNA